MDSSILAYSHDDSIPLGRKISEELDERAIAQMLTALSEKGKPCLTMLGAITYAYAVEKTLEHLELSDEPQNHEFTAVFLAIC